MEETHILSISREGFENIMKSYKEKVIYKKLDFLGNFHFLDNLPKNTKLTLSD